MFSQVWKKIAEGAKYQNADWVLKVDADAIFVPNRMRVWFKQNELVPPAGIYLENCKYVIMATSAIWRFSVVRDR